MIKRYKAGAGLRNTPIPHLPCEATARQDTPMPPPQSLHIYSLPLELIDTLRPVNLISGVNNEEPREETKPDVLPAVSQNARTCNICLGASFTDVEDQRSHFRSDWHRYNVKARLEKGKIVNEQEFAVLVECSLRCIIILHAPVYS